MLLDYACITSNFVHSFMYPILDIFSTVIETKRVYIHTVYIEINHMNYEQPPPPLPRPRGAVRRIMNSTTFLTQWWCNSLFTCLYPCLTFHSAMYLVWCNNFSARKVLPMLKLILFFWISFVRFFKILKSRYREKNLFFLYIIYRVLHFSDFKLFYRYFTCIFLPYPKLSIQIGPLLLFKNINEVEIDIFLL